MAEKTLTISQEPLTSQIVNTPVLESGITVKDSFEILRDKARTIVRDADLDLASTRARLEMRYVSEIIKRDTVSQDITKRYDFINEKISFYEGGIDRIQREIDELNEAIFTSDSLDDIQMAETKLTFKEKELNSYKKDLKTYIGEFYKLIDLLNLKESFSDPSSGKMNIGIFSNNQPPYQPTQDVELNQNTSQEVEVDVEDSKNKDVEFSSKPKIETFFDIL
jgi:hypothetical protein